MAATTLTIRHSRFATLTLAKLVASLALHPPISATEADYAPHPAHYIRHLLPNGRRCRANGETDEGKRNNLHILENAAMHLRFISSRSKMDMRTRAGRKRRTRCLDQARPRAAVPPPCGFTNSDMLACEKRQLAGHNLHNYTRRRPSIFSHHPPPVSQSLPII